jgi:NADPH:quinone reductase
MSTKATAARIYEYGEPDFFRFETMDVPDPVGHEVLVRKAVYDSVGKDTFRGSLAVLRPRGTLVQFGEASGFPEPINPFELAPRALYLTWAILPHYNDTPEALAASSADCLRKCFFCAVCAVHQPPTLSQKGHHRISKIGNFLDHQRK